MRCVYPGPGPLPSDPRPLPVPAAIPYPVSPGLRIALFSPRSLPRSVRSPFSAPQPEGPDADVDRSVARQRASHRRSCSAGAGANKRAVREDKESCGRAGLKFKESPGKGEPVLKTDEERNLATRGGCYFS
jgi:hypothetical protein